MKHYSRTAMIGLVAAPALALVLLTACGSSTPANTTNTPTSTNSSANANGATLVNFDTVLKNTKTQACLTAAAGDAACQGDLAALTQAEQQISSCTNSAQLSSDINQFNAALASVATCAASADPNLATPPSVGNAGSGCSVSVINGVATTVGDCTGCQIQQSGGSVSVSCSGSSSSGSSTGSEPTGTSTGSSTGGSGTASSGSCSATVVNGQVQEMGDCTGCTVTQNGDSVSVSCSSSGGTGGGSTGSSTGSSTTGGSSGGTTGSSGSSGSCSASVVNGVLQQSGDCTGCQIQQDGNSVSISCSST